MNRHEIERLIHDAVQREVSQAVRDAKHNPKQSYFYGITDEDIDFGAAGTISIYFYNIVVDEWQDSGKNIQDVRNFFLNETLTIPLGTAVRVEDYVTTWVISNWYCDIADWT